MDYVLTGKAARGVAALLRGRRGNTGGGGTAYATISPDDFPHPFAVRWSAKENNWVIWLPDPAALVLVDDSAETITGITACQKLAAGWYTVDGVSASSTAIYLVVTVTEASGTTPASNEVELADSPGSASTGKKVYSLLAAEISTDQTTGAKSVKQGLTSSVTIGTGEKRDLDETSIDENTSDEVEIKGWETGTPAGSNTLGDILDGDGGTGEDAELLICRQSDGKLIFRAIGSVSGSGGGLSGSFSFLGGTKYDPSSGVHQLQQRVDTVTIGNGQITVTYGSNNAANPQIAQWDMIPGGQAVPLTGA